MLFGFFCYIWQLTILAVRNRQGTVSYISYNKQGRIYNDGSGKNTETGRAMSARGQRGVRPIGLRISVSGIQVCLPVAVR